MIILGSFDAIPRGRHHHENYFQSFLKYHSSQDTDGFFAFGDVKFCLHDELMHFLKLLLTPFVF